MPQPSLRHVLQLGPPAISRRTRPTIRRWQQGPTKPQSLAMAWPTGCLRQHLNRIGGSGRVDIQSASYRFAAARDLKDCAFLGSAKLWEPRLSEIPGTKYSYQRIRAPWPHVPRPRSPESQLSQRQDSNKAYLLRLISPARSMSHLCPSSAAPTCSLKFGKEVPEPDRRQAVSLCPAATTLSRGTHSSAPPGTPYFSGSSGYLSNWLASPCPALTGGV